MKTLPDLGPITITASRLLRDGSPDPCSDPNYSGTDYCRTRLVDATGTPESPAEWNARQLRALDVTVTRGRTPNAASKGFPAVPTWVWIAGAALLALVFRGRYDRR